MDSEVTMENKSTVRAPESQKPHVVKKPKDITDIGGTVSIEINEKKVSVPLGTTILEACRENNIHIPTLCHHDDLCIAGNCRVCVVEVEGMRCLQASCAFPITAPMKIKTSTPDGEKSAQTHHRFNVERTLRRMLCLLAKSELRVADFG